MLDKDIVELSYKSLGLFVFKANGSSMIPVIPAGSVLHVYPVNDERDIHTGDVVLADVNEKWVCHRVLRRYDGGILLLKGDNNPCSDPLILYEQVLGKVIYVLTPWRKWRNINKGVFVVYGKTVAIIGRFFPSSSVGFSQFTKKLMPVLKVFNSFDIL